MWGYDCLYSQIKRGIHMYKIIKILNNNAIVCKHEHEELIVVLKGIGFSKKVDQCIDIPSNAKKYLMQKSYKGRNGSNDIVNYIDPVYLEIASEIIRHITIHFHKVDNDILLPLADHIFFAIKRMDENIMPSNPFTKDIQLLFPEEFEIALKGKEIIEKYIHKSVNDDEVGFITLHIHSAISNNRVGQAMEATRVVHESIQKLQTSLHIKIDLQSISYVRLMNHIKFLIIRLNNDEKLEMDIDEFTKVKFPFAYEQAVSVCDSLSKVLNKDLPKSEVGYLALHLERILSSIQN